MGTKGIMALQNLAPNKFQERLSGASRMQENLLAARPGLCCGPHWGANSAPDPLAGGEGAGCPFPRTLPPLSAL